MIILFYSKNRFFFFPFSVEISCHPWVTCQSVSRRLKTTAPQEKRRWIMFYIILCMMWQNTSSAHWTNEYGKYFFFFFWSPKSVCAEKLEKKKYTFRRALGKLLYLSIVGSSALDVTWARGVYFYQQSCWLTLYNNLFLTLRLWKVIVWFKINNYIVMQIICYYVGIF